MAINLTKLNTKLDAILSKNLDDIVARQVKLPFMSDGYTKVDLQAWLDKRTSLLNQTKTFTDIQVTNAMNSLYNSLSTNDKALADKILAGTIDVFNPSSADAYDKLVGIILYKFVTTP